MTSLKVARWSLAALVSTASLIAATALRGDELALRRVLLSSGGLGYYEYEAEIDGNATVELTVPLDQVDDVLKSLVVFDEKGGVGGLDLPSRERLDQEETQLDTLKATRAAREKARDDARRTVQDHIAGL